MANKQFTLSPFRQRETIFFSEEFSSSEEDDEHETIDVAMKRRSEDSTNVTSKRAKKAEDEEEEKTGEATRRWRRLWSEEDEIAMLQGIVDFIAETKKTPSEDGPGSYRFVKKLISFDANYHQYMDKVRHLKRKYMTRLKKGVEPTFRNDNDQKCFKLSKIIWGDDEVMVLESNVKLKKSETSKTYKQDLFSSCSAKKSEGSSSKGREVGSPESYWFEESYLVQSIENLGVDSVKQRWSMVPVETKKKIKEKLKSLQYKEDDCQKKEEILQAKKRECALAKSDLLHEVISLLT